MVRLSVLVAIPPLMQLETGGISLSPAFVVMFVMQQFQISWEDALHAVQNRRYCISPNGGFLTQIKVRDTILRVLIEIRHPGIRGNIQSKHCSVVLPYD